MKHITAECYVSDQFEETLMDALHDFMMGFNRDHELPGKVIEWFINSEEEDE